jgi:transaldolase/glucose-6-phosphate isomerase
LEQLIDESSGKQGRGIIVVDDEPVANPESYGIDRLFIYLRHDGGLDASVEALQQAGYPVLRFEISDVYDLGAEFYRWEVATAFACSVLGINAFDQPDVQDNKSRTVNKINIFNQSGRLDEGEAIWKKLGIQAFSKFFPAGLGLKESLQIFMEAARTGSGRNYVAINAYLPRNATNTKALTELRLAVREKTGCATTLGFGPRFLHSTGQLHKGGPDSGLFLEITADPVLDVDIPGQKMSFGTLERCQALGDYEALAARDRRILRLHLDSPNLLMELVKAVR